MHEGEALHTEVVHCSQVHSDEIGARLVVYEVSDGLSASPPMAPHDFLELVYALRITTSHSLSSPVANSIAVDQWLALGVVSTARGASGASGTRRASGVKSSTRSK